MNAPVPSLSASSRRRGGGLSREPRLAGTARWAFAWFLAFIVGVYSSAPQLVPALDPLSPGQTLIALAAVALAWAVLVGRHPLRLGLAAGGAALYVFFAFLAASPAWSMAPALSQEAIRESLKYLVAFIVAANVLHDRRRIRVALVVIALASLFPALGALESYLRGIRLVEGTRASWLGVFGNPNYLAYTLAVSTPLALGLRETVDPDASARGLRRVAWLGVVGLYAVAVLLTGSRGGTLGLAAVLLLWFARGLARGRMALGAGLVVASVLLLTPGGPWDRAETQATLHGEVDMSAQGRIDAWRTAIRIVKAEPGLGVGAGAFVVGYDKYAPGDAGPARTAHNSLLMIAAELGLPAALCFAVALLLAFLQLGAAAQRAPDHGVLERAVQTGLFGFVVCSMTGSYTFTWPLYFLLGISAALVLGDRRRLRVVA